MSSINSNNLLVRPITTDRESRQVEKVLVKWSQMSFKRLQDKTLPSETRDRLVDSRKICEESISLIKSSRECNQFRLYVCFDKKKIAQGIACAWLPKNANKIYLSKIVTCPWNILALNQFQKAHTVKGSGTAILAQLQSDAKKVKKDLSLNSLPNAQGFYLKLGFKVDRNNDENKQDSIPMTFHYSQ